MCIDIFGKFTRSLLTKFFIFFRALRVTLQNTEVSELMVWFDTNGSVSFDYNEFCKQLFGADVLTRPLSLPSIIPMWQSTLVDKPIFKSVGSSISSIGREKKSGNSSLGGYESDDASVMSNSTWNSSYSVSSVGSLASNMTANMKVFESKAKKRIKKEMRKQQIVTEKAQLESKLEMVERQRDIILKKHQARRRRNEHSNTY